MFIRYAAFHLQQLSATKQRGTTEQKSIEDEKDKPLKSEETKEVKQEEKDKKENTENKEKDQKETEKKETKNNVQVDVKKDSNKIEKDLIEEIKGEKSDKDIDLMLNENYSDIDTDVAKKIVESITDSICNGEKQEDSSKSNFQLNIINFGTPLSSLKSLPLVIPIPSLECKAIVSYL